MKMSDIKMVISLLCKHLNQVVDTTLKPEHIRLAKFNKDTDNTVIQLWKVLYQLCSFTFKEIFGDILSNDYDEITSVKLYFAYLQYLVPEFYALPSNCQEASRELLLALSWLIATQNVLAVATDGKILNSILAQEFSDSHVPQTHTANNDNLSSTNTDLNRIMHTCGQINYNVKSMFELVSEKVKLVTKAHAASINVSGLPHLSISEIVLIKQLAMGKFTENEQQMSDLRELVSVLETHAKWEARRHIFFDWMVTVIEEHKMSQLRSVPSKESDCELTKFVCLLRHVVKKNLHKLKNLDETSSDLASGSLFVSRFLRTRSSHSETEMWISEVKQQLENEEEIVKMETRKLASQLKKMLKLIPHCVKV